MKKFGIFLAIFGLLILSSAAYLILNSKNALAAQAGDPDGVQLGIISIGSSDDGATWHNFSGTDLAQGETLTVSPGGAVQFAIFVFGAADTLGATNVQIEGNVTNAAYVADLQVPFLDVDHDGNDFNGFTFTGGGIGTVAQVLPGPDNTQILQGSIQLSNNFPVGQTVLLGRVSIVDYTVSDQVYRPFHRLARALGIKSAQAEGVDRFSAIQIAVNVNGSSSNGTKKTPSPSPTPTPAVSQSVSQTTNLPQTGGGILDDLMRFLKLY